jgi:hypothetical protein
MRFIRELEALNWIWSAKQANHWVENYVTTFRDVLLRKVITVLSSFSIQTEGCDMGFPSPLTISRIH